MPRYEYVCVSCGTGVDVSRPVDDREKPVVCPICNSDAFYNPTFSGSIIFSGKQWMGRNSVCWEADSERTVARKQLAACADDPKSKMPRVLKRRLLDQAAKEEGL
jgi:putative FmdB family regulatory protein